MTSMHADREKKAYQERKGAEKGDSGDSDESEGSSNTEEAAG